MKEKTAMLEGLLVDLVAIDERFDALEHQWENSEAAFWGDAGGRNFFSKATIKRHQQERREHEGPAPYVGFGIQTKDGTPIGVFFIGDFKPAHLV